MDTPASSHIFLIDNSSYPFFFRIFFAARKIFSFVALDFCCCLDSSVFSLINYNTPYLLFHSIYASNADGIEYFSLISSLPAKIIFSLQFFSSSSTRTSYPSHMPFHMAENMLCPLQLFDANRHQTNLICCTLSLLFCVRFPSTFGKLIQSCQQAFCRYVYVIASFSPSLKINTVRFSIRAGLCFLFSPEVSAVSPCLSRHAQNAATDILHTSVLHSGHRQLRPVRSSP